jgi:hypothetical protein
MAKKQRQKSLFPELDEIIGTFRSGEEQDLLILFVPSHDRKQAELPDQPFWAQSALELIGDLFGGATSFVAFAGVYKADDGRLLYDKPILVESYVKRVDLENRAILTELLRFAKRMGRETNQEAVGIVINRVFHYITDFADR